MRVALVSAGIRRDVVVTGFEPVVFDVELTPRAVVSLRFAGAGEG